MRLYLEAKEIAEEGGEFVRLDVTDKTQAEQDSILTALKDFMSGLSCNFIKHSCWHDGTPGQHPLCQTEAV